MFADAQVHKSGNSLHVSHGNDAGLWVEFSTEAVHQEFESKKEGRPIYKDTPFVMMMFPGDKTKKIFRPAKLVRDDEQDLSPTDIERFPAQWAQFQRGQTQTMVGTPLTEWAALSKSECAELKAMNIHTVDQLASLPDGALSWFGARERREAAKAWLSKATDGAAVTAMAQENEQLKQQMAALQAQMAALASQMPEPPKNAAPAALVRKTDMQGKKLTGSGFAPLQTLNLVGDNDLAVVALGSTQATAYPIVAVNTLVATAAASTGVVLPASSPGDTFIVCNGGANALTIYPPVGGRINGGTLNAGVSLATLKAAGPMTCVDPAGLNFFYNVSA